jgi:type 1 glutamine amidotransferase
MIPVLVISDDFWHPAEVIEKGFRSLKQDEYCFEFVTDPRDILTPEDLKTFPVIANCKSDRMNASNPAPWFGEDPEVNVPELDAYVKEGGGLLSIHAANTAKEGSAYSQFVGNVFKGHPPRCTVEVKISGSHPIVKGLGDFSVRDEHYQINYFAENATELFTTLSEKGGTQVGGYVQERGKGRLCVMTPGHVLSVWTHPTYQQILLRALKWCTGN